MEKRIKYLILTGIILTIAAVSLAYVQWNNEHYLNNTNNFRIEHNKTGYDIYKDGVLIWEFTKQNTDSLSLETLRMIHEGD